MLSFSLDDADGRWTRVRVESDAPLAATELVRDGRRWVLEVPAPDLARLEYRFEVSHEYGGPELVCDPANPLRVATAFGDRSVLELPGYEAPWWLDAAGVAGRRQSLRVPGETQEAVPVTVWSPRDAGRSAPLPLLVVHDGPEYDRLADVTRYSAAMVAAGRVPAHRVALLHPVHRDEWYSASPQYLSTLVGPVLGAVRGRHATSSVVVMGASLGGLTSLLAGVHNPELFAGVFSQAGSFFTLQRDPQESGYRYFPRITGAVAELVDECRTTPSLRVGLTCGALEENAGNNREMAGALRRGGHRVTHAEVPDLHSYTAWRDSLDPHLTAVLQDCWS
ncbi:MAG: alpha/beta hydrolase [Actinomycetes bacterium]